MSSNLKVLERTVEKFKTKIENLNPSDDASRCQDEVEQLEEIQKNIEDLIETLENDAENDEDFANQKPLINKFEEQKKEFDILKNKFFKKKDDVRSAHAKELLMEGKLTGVEQKKAQRDLALDNVKEVDEQGLLIDSIHSNIKSANSNFSNMNEEAKKQGEKLDNIGDTVLTMETSVKKTEKTFSEMERRIICRKCIVWFTIIGITLANIVMVWVILAKRFGWPGFGPDTPKDSDTPAKEFKGIDYDQNAIISFDGDGTFKKNNLTFVILKGGEIKANDGAFKDHYDKAKEKEVKVGMYWNIKADDESGAFEQVNAASNYIENLKTETNKEYIFNYGFYFKFTGTYQPNNSTEAEKFCGNVTIDCGVAISYDNYQKNYKNNLKNLQNVKKFWISPYSNLYKSDKDDKVYIWTTDKKQKLGDYEYTIIQAKE